jgi:hypothetical protein
MHKEPLPVLMGPPPWSTEDIEYVTFRNLKHVQARLRDHPGRPIKEQLDSIRSVLRLFNKSANVFLANIERFHVEAHTNNLFGRTRRDERRALEEELQEGLYVFTSCAMTLADQTRTLSRLANIPGYTDRKDAAFANNPLHRFIQELRVDVVHVTFHDLSWRLVAGDPNDRSTTFLLHSSQLNRAKDYKPLAKQYVSHNPKGVDLGLLVRNYRDQVNEFHEWLRTALDASIGERIQDYERSARIMRAIGSRTWWSLIMSQVVIQRKLDPFDYLDQYLTAADLAEILALPHRSKQQVDRVIKLVDEYGACNDELRVMVYQAFGVVGA